VHDRVVLDARAGADADRTVVAADHDAEPDARLFADFDVADQDGGRSDERRRRDLRMLSAKFDEHDRPPENVDGEAPT